MRTEHRFEANCGPGPCTVLALARSGVMHLTGHADGPPLAPPAPIFERLEVIARDIARIAAVDLDLAAMLAGRAALLGLTRAGRTAPGGTCRLLRAADGWVAVNLARSDDIDAVPAVIARDDEGDPCGALEQFARERTAAELAARLQLLAIPAATLRSATMEAVVQHRIASGRPSSATPLVLDLSAMWAGPTCAQILGWAGMKVVKVESPDRPDAARAGNERFFEWLHRGHDQFVLDLRDDAVRELVERADIVLEASRPRALAQLGIGPGNRAGQTWVSITGYGRARDEGMRVAFGDDAAVAGGLIALDPEGDPVFCGDAIADPTAGIAAARAALASRAAGGGHLVEVRMAGVAASLAAPDERLRPHVTRLHGDEWVVHCGRETASVMAPRSPC